MNNALSCPDRFARADSPRIYLIALGIAIAVHALVLFSFRYAFDFGLNQPESADSGITVQLEVEPRSAPPPPTAPIRPVLPAPAAEAAPETQTAERQTQQAQTSARPQPAANPAASASQPPDNASAASAPAVAPAALAVNPAPPYPDIARQRGQEGRVLLLVQVDSAGKVTGVRVQTSSGYQLLDNSALNTVRKWRFSPAQISGKAAAGEILLPVDFKLK